MCIRTVCQVVNWATWKHVGDANGEVAGSSDRLSAGAVPRPRRAEAVVPM